MFHPSELVLVTMGLRTQIRLTSLESLVRVKPVSRAIPGPSLHYEDQRQQSYKGVCLLATFQHKRIYYLSS